MHAGDKISLRTAKKLVADGLKSIVVTESDLIGQFLAMDLVDSSTGEVIAEAGEEITEALLAKMDTAGLKAMSTLFIDNICVLRYL